LNTGIDKRLCIRLPEAADIPCISGNIMYALINQGKLYVIRFGKRLLVARAEPDRIIEEGVTQCKV